MAIQTPPESLFMAASGSKLRNLMIFIALAGIAFGTQSALKRRAYCLRTASNFVFWEELNEQRISPLVEKASKTQDPLAAQIWTEEAERARVEAKRCVVVAKMYKYAADHPWLALPPEQHGPEYAPYRSSGGRQ